MLYSRKIVLLAFPAVTIAAGVAVLLTGFWDYKKELNDIENLFKTHADSLAALLAEGTREASASTSLIYEVTEDHLAASAHLLTSSERGYEGDSDHLRAAHGVSLLVIENEQGEFKGQWGPVPSEKRAKFVSWMMDNEENIIADDGPNRALGLACLRYPISGRAGIICVPAARLAKMRREIGIGPLLKKVIQKDVLYVALQDRDGIIAAAPPDAPIVGGQRDILLAEVLDGADPAGISRYTEINRRPIFERLIPFIMPDESRVVLRLGIDASVPTEVRAKAERRFLLSLILVLGVTLLTAFLAVSLWIRSRRAETMEQRLAEARAAQEHWSAIGQMAATVAHEVRNPLNTIGMVSQRLLAETAVAEADRPEFEEMVSLLLSESERVGRVVTEFLDLGKPLTLQSADVSLREVTDETLLPCRMRAGNERKQLEVIHQCDEVVHLDRGRFRQMLTNVVDNALDAVGLDGVVTVETVGRDDLLTVRVTDNGPGLSEDELEAVLKPFVSFKKTGTGLGLPLVKRIVEAHGGSLKLNSLPGRGTTVEMDFPRKEVRA